MTTDYTKIGEAFAAIADLRRYTIDNGYAKMRVAIDGEGPKHWAARVRRDRGQKGGVDRHWLTRGDEHWYHVADLSPGDVIEIGASAYSLKRLMKAGEKPDRTKRLYRQVAAMTDECLLFVAVDDEQGNDRWREVASALDGAEDDQADPAEDAQVQSALPAADKTAAITLVVGTTAAAVEAQARLMPASALRIRFPETGLHPHDACLYMSHLVEWLTANGGAVVVLTMSEAIVNHVGRLVLKGAIRASGVAIVGQHQDGEPFQASVRDNGAFAGWLYGFSMADLMREHSVITRWLCVPLPDDVRARWLDALDAVCEEIGVRFERLGTKDG